MTEGRPSLAALRAASIMVAVYLYPCHDAPAMAGALATFDYPGGSSLKAAYGELHFVIDSVGPSADEQAPRLRAFSGDKPVFVMRLDATPGPNASAAVKVVRLEGPVPQVVFQHFTYGAHCCTETKIATSQGDDGRWVIVDAPTIDGDGGYDFEDIGGAGSDALVSRDDSFLYLFASYAGSVAPIKIQNLEGAGRLVDATRDPRSRQAVAADLARLEKDAGENDLWHENGFLAGWVTTKILLGEGPAAWLRMLKDYDRDSDYPMKICADFVPDDRCAEDRMRPADLPEALRVHLLRTGYIKDVGAYPLPPAKPRDRSR